MSTRQLFPRPPIFKVVVGCGSVSFAFTLVINIENGGWGDGLRILSFYRGGFALLSTIAHLPCLNSWSDFISEVYPSFGMWSNGQATGEVTLSQKRPCGYSCLDATRLVTVVVMYEKVTLSGTMSFM